MAEPTPNRENQTFVFHDARGRRWPRVKRTTFALGVVLFLAFIAFVRSLLIQPQLRLPGSVLQLRSQLQGLQRLPGGTVLTKDDSPGPRHSMAPSRSHRHPTRDPERIQLGFYVNWDRASFASLQQYGENLTHLSPEWISFKNEEGDLELKNQSEVESYAATHDLKLVPLLTNYFEGWRGDLVEALITSALDRQNAFIDQVIGLCKGRHYAGVTLDFEEVALEYEEPFNDFLTRFSDRCHKQNLLFLLCVPMGLDSQVFDLDRLADHTDYFVAMLYDENSRHDAPGPIASQAWFERWLKRLLEFGDSRQWIVGLGAFGCDWSSEAKVGRVLTFADAMALADSLDTAHVEMLLDAGNPMFEYKEDQAKHTVWFLDAVTAYNEAVTARRAKTAGVAVWRLGSEDPKLWDALRWAGDGTIGSEDVAAMGVLKPQDHITHIGEGEIVRAHQNLKSGARTVSLHPNGLMTEVYHSFPSDVTLEHYGKVQSDWVALTFDDGPDERWTPKILDVLKKEHVPATFFVVGNNMERNPELVLREVNEGHEIGNHSYTHPNLADISEVQVDLELNATQRLLESVIGRSTFLFRPPYLADSRPQVHEEARPIVLAEKLGYVTICENIDPEDWARPGVDAILQRVRTQRAEGSIVLLHDGGGDRSQTLEALPRLIRALREDSHGKVQFVTTSKLLGLSRDEVMPPAPLMERMTIRTSSLGLSMVYFFEEMVWAFMIVSSVLVLVRTLFIAVLAMIQKMSRQGIRLAGPPGNDPSISVLIAAYNEEKVIVQTIHSVLNNGYPGEFEVVVVDDGSTDGTKEVVRRAFEHESRVRLFVQANAGKSSALLRAFWASKDDILVSLDADTQLSPGALRELVQPFMRSREIGAVSGNAKVGNRGKWLTEFQSLEYICGFNLDRRAYDLLNCITVVPGAIGAYRREAVDQAGGFTAETLAEDTDLTLHIRKDGWRIAYAENAIGWTESPETFRSLTKQRFRWAFGTLQCLWKHRDALFNPRYGALGWIALPSMWLFQIGLVAAAPFVDLLMICSLISGNGIEVALYFFAFILSDIILAGVALALEGEHVARAFWVLPQRFVYRLLLSLVVWNSVRRAVRGALVGWGKVERMASVRNP